MKRIRHSFFLLGMLVCLLAGGCRAAAGARENPEKNAVSPGSLQVLTIGTADSGGTMYPAGKAIASLLSQYDDSLKCNVAASNGSVVNVRDLMDGNIDLGLVSGDVAFCAVQGTDDFAGAPAEKLRVIAAVYPSLSNWVTLASSGLSYVHDLKGKQIGIGPQDSTTDIAAELALSVCGVTKENAALTNCGLGAGAELVKKGTLDAVHGFTGIPVESFAGLAADAPCRVLRYTDDELNEIIRSNPFYFKSVIPAGTYTGQYVAVPTFGIKCLLCVNADMDEELVYEITKLLYSHAGELQDYNPVFSALEKRSFLYSSLPITLHPGAERFYTEQGLLETEQ